MSSGAFLQGRAHPPLRPSQHPRFDAVFLDRDGTLNHLLPGYRTVADLTMLSGAAEAVARINADGVPVVLVTNQQGLATGALSWPELEAVHRLLCSHLAAVDAHLDDIRVCPHRAGTCQCRKPLPGLLRHVLSENPWITPQRCLMVGDTDGDAAAAAAAGIAFRRVGEHLSLAQVVSETFA